MKRTTAKLLMLVCCLAGAASRGDDATVIEEQLKEIGTIHNDEVVVVQRKYTRKNFRHEFTPVIFGGVPFGTVRRTLLGGASYTLHLSDSWGLELFNFAYTKNFFSSFTTDINENKVPNGSGNLPANIKPDFQKLLFFLTGGIQWSPFYGKVSTFSRYIAYVEPYIGLGAGLAKTEASQYLTFYPAIGLRAFFREWFSMRIELRDYLYTERFMTRENPPQEQTALRNNYAVTLSLSFWLPKMP